MTATPYEIVHLAASFWSRSSCGLQFANSKVGGWRGEGTCPRSKITEAKTKGMPVPREMTAYLIVTGKERQQAAPLTTGWGVGICSMQWTREHLDRPWYSCKTIV